MLPPDAAPEFFATASAWRRWLERNHARRDEVWVGFHKVASKRKSVRWSESVDEALCFGWIDGVRHRIDDDSYAIRFTPRRPTSRWSRVNVAKVAVLTRQGKMRPAGLALFAARREEAGEGYSYEPQRPARLPAEFARRLRANAAAQAFFRSRPPWYRRTAIRWIRDAKRVETRERRFTTLLEDSAAGRTLKPLTRPTGKATGESGGKRSGEGPARHR